jgi:hypothetical protein
MGISTFTSKECGPFFAGYLADWQCDHPGIHSFFNIKRGLDAHQGATRREDP